jgi:uncharacterized protein YcfL
MKIELRVTGEYMKTKYCLFSLLLGILVGCATSHPIYNVVDSPVPAGLNGELPSTEEVKMAIVKAATFKRWQPTSVDEDTIEASIAVRNRHQAKVAIDYTRFSYSITLIESVGLDEKNGMIHRNYNKWVHLLDQQIQTELAQGSY